MFYCYWLSCPGTFRTPLVDAPAAPQGPLPGGHRSTISERGRAAEGASQIVGRPRGGPQLTPLVISTSRGRRSGGTGLRDVGRDGGVTP